MSADEHRLTEMRCHRCNRSLPVRYRIRGQGTVSAWCRKCKVATEIDVTGSESVCSECRPPPIYEHSGFSQP